MGKAYDVIRAHYDASDRGDLAGMIADIAPDCQWTEMDGFPARGTYVGPDAVVENVFKRLGGLFEGFALKVERLIDGGDDVVAIGEYSGTHRVTGKPFKARVVHVWSVRDGKIRRFEQFTDTLRVAESMR